MKKVTAVIPVFNEEKRVKNVLSVLIKSDLIDEIIAIDDASTDHTLKIIKSFKSKKFKVVHLEKNLGKGGAIKVGARNLTTDIIFFCDGDLKHFSEKNIQQILAPFENNQYLMSVGLRDYNGVINFIGYYFFPLVSGERALNYSIFKNVISDPMLNGYGIELVLNDYCQQHKIPIYKNIMSGVKQINKPFKMKNGTWLFIQQCFKFLYVWSYLKIRRLIYSIFKERD